MKQRADQVRSKFTIFLGYAPGVGKSFRMLGDAHALKGVGVDVVLGRFNSDRSPRQRTTQLTGAFDNLPVRKYRYEAWEFVDLDTPAVIARNPELVLIDELARRNGPRTTSNNRYQDVQKILDANIGVHTTLNIRHIESVADEVSQITGKVVQSLVPDWVVKRADKLVYVAPEVEEVRERFLRGEIVGAERMSMMEKAYSIANLTRLREIGLRIVRECERGVD